MSWSEVHAAALGACTPAEALAAARSLVATCAVGPVDVSAAVGFVEHRWSSAQLGDLATRLRGRGARRVARVTLIPAAPADAVRLVTVARSLPSAVVRVHGASTPELYTHLVFDGAVASVELHGRPTLAAARAAVEAQLARAVDLGLAPPDALARALAADRDALVAGIDADGWQLICRSFTHERPNALRCAGPARARWSSLWPGGPSAIDAVLDDPDAVTGLATLCAAAGDDDAIAELDLDLTDDQDLDALVDPAFGVPAVITWSCGFDGYGRAYHGVGLGLHAEHDEVRVRTVTPDRHELVVRVDAKRIDAREVVARIAAASGLAFARAR